MDGRLFVIESGTDGAGKATQSDMLYKRLKNDGFNVIKVSFPNYDSESSVLVKMYLRGDFGKNADDVNPYIASTFFAADRYASYKMDWESFYKNGGIVIADRYTTSNMVYQASKMDNDDEKEKFLNWLDDFEYNLYGIPRPSEVYFLDVPVDVSSELIKDRKNKFTNEEEKDIHESDVEYLEKTYRNAGYVSEKYNWKKIDCTRKCNDSNQLGSTGKAMKTVEEIHEEIYSMILKLINMD